MSKAKDKTNKELADLLINGRVRIRIREDRGWYMITSPHLWGFFLTGTSLMDLMKDLPDAIKLICEDRHKLAGIKVEKSERLPFAPLRWFEWMVWPRSALRTYTLSLPSGYGGE